MIERLRLNLQLFADGAGEGTTGETVSVATTSGQALSPKEQSRARLEKAIADDKAAREATQAPATQTAEVTETAETTSKISFDDLIKGDYKEDYDKRVQDAINKRFKNHQKLEESLSKVSPVLDILANKYGKDPADVDGIMSAMDSDSSYFADYALEHGVSEDEARRIYKLERDNKAMLREKQQREQEEANKAKFASLIQAAEKTKQTFPTFDLQTEMQNADYARLVFSGIDPTAAYKAIHHDEIITSTVQLATQQAATMAAQSKAANQSRPAENGLANQAASVFDSDPRNWTKEQRADLMRRLKAGEKPMI